MNGVLLALRIALDALRVNKMRSLLTMLGIIIGNAAVIIVVGVGNGASKMIEDQISGVGSNLLLILPGSTTAGGIRAGIGTLPSLTGQDVRALRAECPSVRLVAASVRGTAQVVYGSANWSTLIQGTSQDMLAMRDWRLTRGREMTEADVDGSASVCILGSTVAEMLFGSGDPVGRQVRIKGMPFTVIGVLESKGRLPTGVDQDDEIIMPFTTTSSKILGSPIPDSVGTILVQARDALAVPQAQNEIIALLDQRHHIGPTRERDYSVRDLTEMLAVSQKTAHIMALLLGAVASVSLMVGGIGIMNIMLVSVTERTREIGIRMSIGAKRRQILMQFLAEAVVLTLTGGAIGLLLGAGASAAISRIYGWPTSISFEAAAFTVVFSCLIGVFFGYYPARKAALCNPIDALRVE